MTSAKDKSRDGAAAAAGAKAAPPGAAPVRLFDAARLGKLFVCIAGIYVFFVLWAVLQERGAWLLDSHVNERGRACTCIVSRARVCVHPSRSVE